MVEVINTKTGGVITLLYPSHDKSTQVQLEHFTFDIAVNALPVKGNGRLIVISHGSMSSPWTQFDLARTMVEAGFFVAFPEHVKDNQKDGSETGITSWKRRPLEVSNAIDVITNDAGFRNFIAADNIGVYGMSAGGHTVLTLAGGRWSPAKLRAHCEKHIDEDFQACVGTVTQLKGNLFDSVKKSLARLVLSIQLRDKTWYAHTDYRVKAIVAGVPFAADFDPDSLTFPKLPLGIITARLDKSLLPKYHSDLILGACKTCEHIADFEKGSHGALLSPIQPGLTGLHADILYDPDGFQRKSVVPEVNLRIVSFFMKHLFTKHRNEISR